MSTRTSIGIVVLLLAIAGVIYAVMGDTTPAEPLQSGNSTDTPATTTTTKTYTNAKYSISFTYPDTYLLSEMNPEGNAQREHHVITLIRAEDLPAPEGGEGPPSITIEMFQNNLDSQTTEQWIRGSSASNFKLSPDGRTSTTTVDGKQAISYRWSGLYEGTTVALAESNWIYTFSVTYLDMGADIVQDFVRIRNSVRITQ